MHSRHNADGQNMTVSLADIESFSHNVSSSFVPLEVSQASPNDFWAQLSMAGADNIYFTQVSAKPHLVQRTEQCIEAGGSGFYKVSLLLEGSSLLVQDGKELVMKPGDLSIYDTSRPYSLMFNEEFTNLIMMLPKNRFQLPVQYTEQLVAVPLNAEHPALAQVVRRYISQFPETMHRLTDPINTKLAHTSLELMCTLLSSILDMQPEQRDPRQLLVQKIFRYIDVHLASPELSPASIAAAHFVSIRHLHALFHEAGTSVSATIRERRLERCRQDLIDPVLSTSTIASIAYRWGFTDSAHFSRLFKSTYGISPSEIRHHV